MKRTVLVSGANRGIGLAITRQLAELGNSVLLGSRDLGAGDAAAAPLRSLGLDVASIHLDLTVAATMKELPPSVKVNAMCPGWVRTRMGGESATRTPAEGADDAVWLATLPEDGPTGGFFRNRKPIDW